MNTAPTLHTARTILRAHTRADLEPMAAIRADPVAMRHFGRTFTRDETWQRLLGIAGCWPLLGYGYWAVEDRESGTYLGLAGLADFGRGIPEIEGIPEAGWVLGTAAHGRGIGTEVVLAIMDWADAHIDAPETCCIIDPDNAGSFRVAEKAGYARGPSVPFDGKQIVVLTRPRHAAMRMSSSSASSA